MPPLLADFTHARPCKPFCEKYLTLPMREQKFHIYLDSHERTILLHSLVELKNQLLAQGRYADCVDELIFKVTGAPLKKLKVQHDCGRV